MPAVSRLGDISTGHGCFPPTPLVNTPVGKTFFNGILACVVGSQHATHVCGIVVHPTPARPVVSGASKTFIEGSPASRVGDPIGCGDTCGQGSSNSFIE
jgi:uncharacterized Zn-binding protein involved in type VI secretion